MMVFHHGDVMDALTLANDTDCDIELWMDQFGLTVAPLVPGRTYFQFDAATMALFPVSIPIGSSVSLVVNWMGDPGWAGGVHADGYFTRGSNPHHVPYSIGAFKLP